MEPPHMLYLGIDPGASGGIACIDDDRRVALVTAMPDTERDILDALLALVNPHFASIRASLERASASPQMGTVSAFKFGTSAGALRMALTAAKIPFDEVTSVTWQRELRCLQPKRPKGTPNPIGSKDKNITKRRAQQLFPHVNVTHAIADALLIAEFSRRMSGKATPIPARKLFDGEEDEAGEEGQDKVGAGVWDEDHEEVSAPAGKVRIIHAGGYDPAKAASGRAAGDGAAGERTHRERRQGLRRRSR